VSAAATSLDSFEVERLAGDLGAATGELRRDRDLLEAMGETYLRSTITGYLAKLLAELGEAAEAEALVAEAESLSADDDAESQLVWRLAKARLLAERDPAEARALVLAGLESVRGTDAVLLHAEALQDLAAIEERADAPDAARSALEEALEIHRRKGSVLGAANVEARLALLRAGGRPRQASERSV
jgi:tetratricopeptide (TPR) repeat protein